MLNIKFYKTNYKINAKSDMLANLAVLFKVY